MLYRRPLSEIARWPAWELDLLEHYLAREPAPDERVEIAIARLIAVFVEAHQGKNAAKPKVTDFLPYLKTWPAPDDGRYNEVDREVLQELL